MASLQQADGATVKYVPGTLVADTGGTILVQLSNNDRDAADDQVQQDTIISATRVEIRPAPKHIPCGSNCGGKSLDVRDGGAWVRVLAVGCAGSAGMSVIFEADLKIDTVSLDKLRLGMDYHPETDPPGWRPRNPCTVCKTIREHLVSQGALSYHGIHEITLHSAGYGKGWAVSGMRGGWWRNLSRDNRMVVVAKWADVLRKHRSTRGGAALNFTDEIWQQVVTYLNLPPEQTFELPTVPDDMQEGGATSNLVPPAKQAGPMSGSKRAAAQAYGSSKRQHMFGPGRLSLSEGSGLQCSSSSGRALQGPGGGAPTLSNYAGPPAQRHSQVNGPVSCAAPDAVAAAAGADGTRGRWSSLGGQQERSAGGGPAPSMQQSDQHDEELLAALVADLGPLPHSNAPRHTSKAAAEVLPPPSQPMQSAAAAGGAAAVPPRMGQRAASSTWPGCGVSSDGGPVSSSRPPAAPAATGAQQERGWTSAAAAAGGGGQGGGSSSNVGVGAAGAPAASPALPPPAAAGEVAAGAGGKMDVLQRPSAEGMGASGARAYCNQQGQEDLLELSTTAGPNRGSHPYSSTQQGPGLPQASSHQVPPSAAAGAAAGAVPGGSGSRWPLGTSAPPGAPPGGTHLHQERSCASAAAAAAAGGGSSSGGGASKQGGTPGAPALSLAPSAAAAAGVAAGAAGRDGVGQLQGPAGTGAATSAAHSRSSPSQDAMSEDLCASQDAEAGMPDTNGAPLGPGGIQDGGPLRPPAPAATAGAAGVAGPAAGAVQTPRGVPGDGGSMPLAIRAPPDTPPGGRCLQQELSTGAAVAAGGGGSSSGGSKQGMATPGAPASQLPPPPSSSAAAAAAGPAVVGSVTEAGAGRLQVNPAARAPPVAAPRVRLRLRPHHGGNVSTLVPNGKSEEEGTPAGSIAQPGPGPAPAGSLLLKPQASQDTGAAPAAGSMRAGSGLPGGGGSRPLGVSAASGAPDDDMHLGQERSSAAAAAAAAAAGGGGSRSSGGASKQGSGTQGAPAPLVLRSSPSTQAAAAVVVGAPGEAGAGRQQAAPATGPTPVAALRLGWPRQEYISELRLLESSSDEEGAAVGSSEEDSEEVAPPAGSIAQPGSGSAQAGSLLLAPQPTQYNGAAMAAAAAAAAATAAAGSVQAGGGVSGGGASMPRGFRAPPGTPQQESSSAAAAGAGGGNTISKQNPGTAGVPAVSPLSSAAKDSGRAVEGKGEGGAKVVCSPCASDVAPRSATPAHNQQGGGHVANLSVAGDAGASHSSDPQDPSSERAGSRQLAPHPMGPSAAAMAAAGSVPGGSGSRPTGTSAAPGAPASNMHLRQEGRSAAAATGDGGGSSSTSGGASKQGSGTPGAPASLLPPPPSSAAAAAAGPAVMGGVAGAGAGRLQVNPATGAPPGAAPRPRLRIRSSHGGNVMNLVACKESGKQAAPADSIAQPGPGPAQADRCLLAPQPSQDTGAAATAGAAAAAALAQASSGVSGGTDGHRPAGSGGAREAPAAGEHRHPERGVALPAAAAAAAAAEDDDDDKQGNGTPGAPAPSPPPPSPSAQAAAVLVGSVEEAGAGQLATTGALRTPSEEDISELFEPDSEIAPADSIAQPAPGAGHAGSHMVPSVAGAAAAAATGVAQAAGRQVAAMPAGASEEAPPQLLVQPGRVVTLCISGDTPTTPSISLRVRAFLGQGGEAQVVLVEEQLPGDAAGWSNSYQTITGRGSAAAAGGYLRGTAATSGTSSSSAAAGGTARLRALKITLPWSWAKAMRDSGWNHTERVYMRHCRRNMQQEYDLLCKFRGHGLIVQAFHVGYVRIQGYGELPALLMEHCAGGSLEAFVKDHVRHFGRGLSYEDARQVMIRANNALRALHLKGIGHGDLKMSNFLFTKAKKSPDAPPALADMGQLKLSDLGCAYVFQPGEPRRDSASTPSHRPPELSRQGASDFRAESWLMGCLLLELRSSRPPFPHLPVEDERRGPAELDNPEGPYHALLNDTEKHLLRALLADPVTRLTMSEIYNHPHYSGYFL